MHNFSQILYVFLFKQIILYVFRLYLFGIYTIVNVFESKMFLMKDVPLCWRFTVALSSII